MSDLGHVSPLSERVGTTSTEGGPQLDDRRNLSQAPLLFLREEPPTEQPRIGLLVSLWKLDLYSSALLTKRVIKELQIVSCLLLVVFGFELLAWSFFFNGLINGDIRHMGLSNGWAVLIALLFAGAVIYFERQVLTADQERMVAWKRVLAQIARAGFIVVSAFIVAQPLELLAFWVPVEKRVHVEGVRREAAKRLALLQEFEEIEDSVVESSPESKLTDIRTEISSLFPARAEAAAVLASTEREIRELAPQVSGMRRTSELAEQRLRDAIEFGRGDAVESLERTRRTSEARYDRAAAELRRLRGHASEAQANVDAIDRRLDLLREREQDLLVEAETFRKNQGLLLDAGIRLRDRLRDWIKTLQEAGPGNRREQWDGFATATAAEKEYWPRQWHEPFEFAEPDYDFFQKLRVVWDLARGRPPVWPAGSDADIERLKEDFGLRDDIEGEAHHVYLAGFIAIHLLALFIPSIILCVKWLLMPEELKSYFSARAQAEAGDRDAILTLRAERRARERSVEDIRNTAARVSDVDGGG